MRRLELTEDIKEPIKEMVRTMKCYTERFEKILTSRKDEKNNEVTMEVLGEINAMTLRILG